MTNAARAVIRKQLQKRKQDDMDDDDDDDEPIAQRPHDAQTGPSSGHPLSGLDGAQSCRCGLTGGRWATPGPR
jgi:hypothetical protein